MKQVYFWAPFNSKIGTINSVINSIISIDKYSKKKFNSYLIDSTNEWTNYRDKFNVINLRKNKRDFRKNKNKGFFWSRFFYLNIFITCFLPLKNILINKKPDYFIAHLITSLPLIIFILFKFETKLILRISGEPKLNIFRKFLWKLAAKKIFLVTCPSIETVEKLKNQQIFDPKIIKVLYDPVIKINEINKKKNYIIEKEYQNQNFFLMIGRLTKQKNFQFVINAFSKFFKKKKLILLILGDGEQKKYLQNLIYSNGMSERIKLLGFRENVFKYLSKADCFILPSLYENPGHVLIEAAACGCPIISSNCPTGPAEILDYGKNGFLFNVNDEIDFKEKIEMFFKQSNLEKNKKIFLSKKNINKFTMFRHFQSFEELFSTSD